jgi:hypothetical protein
MPRDRFPWALLAAAWLIIGLGLTIGFRHLVVSGNFPDTDDYMRLQQVRDLMAGQSWFDLTQHRVAPPGGLAMHWSRLVDVPLLVFLAVLTPVIGAHDAEIVAITGAPLLTLFALLAAVAVVIRRSNGSPTPLLFIGWLFAIMPPLVLAQIHPGRIDHHGWQIALAAGVFAALLDEKPQRSGVVAGVLTALFLTISIEGAAFAAAALATAALLWIFVKDDGVRLARFTQSLAVTTIAATLIFAPAARWTETQCDAVMPGHLAAVAAFAIAATIGIPLTQARSAVWRICALSMGAFAAAVALYAVAPHCLGNPFGTMDPLVQRIWFQNVAEGQPVWTQSAIGVVTALAFPIIGLIGAALAWRRTRARPWLVALLLGAATLATGALVYRAAGIAQIMAIPGAVALAEAALAWAARRNLMVARVVLQAGAVLILSPLGPVVVAAATIPDTPPDKPGTPLACDVNCAMPRLNRLPAMTVMNPIDLGPILVARTHHSVFVASYHRLQGPLGDTIRFFTGSDADARAFMRKHGLRTIVVDPRSDEIGVYRKQAPSGFAAQLTGGTPPPWLRRVDLGAGDGVLVFQTVDS